MRPFPLGARVLIAGVGNVLRCDDGFGIAVADVLGRAPERLPPGARVIEVGIGGITLVHELMDGYDVLVLVDAVDRRGAPGSLYVLEVTVPEVAAIPALERLGIAADMHEAVPGQALIMAGAVGALPPVVRMIGCQPAETEDFSMELGPRVRRAVPDAVETIRGMLLNQDGRPPYRPRRAARS